jgi:hypothetical protein
MAKETSRRSDQSMSHKMRKTDMSLRPTWEAMWKRCTDPNCRGYHWYGAKGVEICDHWRVYANFMADMGPRPKGHTLDRIDPAGHYEPTNCRWADWKTQGSNRRRKATKLPVGYANLGHRSDDRA